MPNSFRVFATCDIGPALDALRKRGYQLEVYPDPKAPPKSLILEKVRSGIDGLITTLRDQIDAEVFEAGSGGFSIESANSTPLTTKDTKVHEGRTVQSQPL